jgi:hypothetical protein
MVTIEHSLKFITEVDETHPATLALLSLSKSEQVKILEGMLKDLVAPALNPIIEDINKNGSYAILKVVA